jgi:hypothetical protein
VRVAARELTPDAMDTLKQVMKDPKVPAAARVSAATAVLDRGHGRPAQKVDIQAIMGAIDLARLSDSHLEQMEALIGLAAGSTSPARFAAEQGAMIEASAIELDEPAGEPV